MVYLRVNFAVFVVEILKYREGKVVITLSESIFTCLSYVSLWNFMKRTVSANKIK